MSSKPALLLLPNVLSDVKYHEPYLPASVDKAVSSIDGLIAESDKGGRRFLSRFETKQKTHLMPMALFNKGTDQDLDFFLEPILGGERWGFVVDAGVPCMADPGARLVYRARKLGIQVQAYVGPSSVMLALMLSGLPGQRFAFHGYIEKGATEAAIQRLEARSRREEATQIFIEAPHRNQQMLEKLLETLDPETHLSICWDLTGKEQKVVTERVKSWKAMPTPNLGKIPAIFLIYAADL